MLAAYGFLLVSAISTSSVGWQDASTQKKISDLYQPNYVDRLLSPFEGTFTKAELFREWTKFPVSVVVFDDKGLLNDSLYATVKRSFERWVAATKSTPGGGVSFTYRRSPSPRGAQIVVHLRRGSDLEPLIGLTLPQLPQWQYIQLAVTDFDGNKPPLELIERVATHEVGHALGIAGHSPDADDIMSLTMRTFEVSSADVNTLRIGYGGRFRRL